MSIFGTLLAITCWNRFGPHDQRKSKFYREMSRKFGIRIAQALASNLDVATPTFDVVIIGGGIVGTASARQLSLK